MAIGIEAYRCAIGRFSAVLVCLLQKKVTKALRKARASDATVDYVYSGREIAVFFTWITLSAVLLFCAPYCVHMMFCEDIFTTRYCIYDTPNSLSFDSALFCAVQRKDYRLDFAMSSFATRSVSDMSNNILLSSHPSPNGRFLLLLCGDIESNPGPPSAVELAVQNMEAKMEDQTTTIERQFTALTEMMKTTTVQLNQQLANKFDSVELSISQGNSQLQQQLVGIKGQLSAIETVARRNEQRVQALENEHGFMNSRMQKVEEEIERQDRFSRRSNVKLLGLREEGGENYDRCATRVIDILQRYFPHKNWDESDIEKAHRLGPSPSITGRPRPVIIKFQSWKDAMIVMKDKEGKNRMKNDDGLRVATDLTQHQRDTISYWREQGKHAYFARGKLVVEERRHYYRDSNENTYTSQSHSQFARNRPRNSQFPPLHNHEHPMDYPKETRSDARQNRASYATMAATSRRSDDAPPTVHKDEDDDDDDISTIGDDKMEDAVSEAGLSDAGHHQEGETAASTTSVPPLSNTGSPGSLPPLRGMGRGTPISSPHYEASAIASGGSSGSRGRGRGRNHSAQQSREQTTPMQTRNRSQTSAPPSSRQQTLLDNWNGKRR